MLHRVLQAASPTVDPALTCLTAFPGRTTTLATLKSDVTCITPRFTLTRTPGTAESPTFSICENLLEDTRDGHKQ